VSWIPGWESVASAGWWGGLYFWLSIGALIALGGFEVASHRYSDRKDELAAAEQKATQAQHDEEMARLHLEAANANKATEELKNENLRLREAVAPRLLEQRAPAIALTKFKGTKAFLTSVPDFEAREFMKYLGFTLQMAGWEVTFMPPREDLFDGVTIEYGASVLDFDKPLHLAVVALLAELSKQGIKGQPGRWGTGHVVDPAMPTDAMQIRVGMKPLPDFVREKMRKEGQPTMYRSGPGIKLPR
jgi:hypothetical protein